MENNNTDIKAEIVNAIKDAAPHVAKSVKEVALVAFTIAARTVKYVAEQVVDVLEKDK